MRFPYSTGGKPLLPIVLSLGAKQLAAEALLDSGADVNVLPGRLGEALGARWDDRKTTIRLAGTLAGPPAMPLLVTGRVADFPAVRLAFAWCRTDEVPLILGQTNFFMEFDICFFRSTREFSVVPVGSQTP
ncbi:MAG: hypothetical protein KIS67_25005 [Verrucomicrobiae bacterium]|nr:hypothetical protein [Verrucomicrobiae bacterium]